MLQLPAVASLVPALTWGCIVSDTTHPLVVEWNVHAAHVTLPRDAQTAQHSSAVVASRCVKPPELRPTPSTTYGVLHVGMGGGDVAATAFTASERAAHASAALYSDAPGYLMFDVHSFCVIGAPVKCVSSAAGRE